MDPGFKPLALWYWSTYKSQKIRMDLAGGCLTRVGTVEQGQKEHKDGYTVGIKNTWSMEDLEVKL